uniref:putative F-box protein At4g21240 n=1 Tax=Erigeron canadensis TaxID=72917 RepID=UPI001CB93E9F|nr:putative F-box protein At4g21240 [Erigeron canadensis]
MSEYIPFEIQTEIIKRLPAKSAVKFRLVSKPWNSYIGSSEFIIAHHRRNIHHQPPRLLAWCKNPSDVDIYVTLFDDDDSFYRQDFTPKSQGLSKVLMDLKVVDCSLGLVCLYGSHYHDPSTSVAILWNPLIKKSVQVVLPPSTTASATRVLAGFGVCPVTFDPIVVSISLPWKAQVFTLSSGTWRSLMSSNLSRRNINLPSAGVGSQIPYHTPIS